MEGQRVICDPDQLENCSASEGCGTCPHGTYQPYRNNCRQCRPCTECKATQQITQECSPEKDRQCAERLDSTTTERPVSGFTASSMLWRDTSQSTPFAEYTVDDTIKTQTPTKVQQQTTNATATDRDYANSQNGNTVVVMLCAVVAVLAIVVAVLVIVLIVTCMKYNLLKDRIRPQDQRADLQEVGEVPTDPNGNTCNSRIPISRDGQGNHKALLPEEAAPPGVQGDSNSDVRPTVHVNHVTGTVQYVAPPVHDQLQAKVERSTSVQPLNTRQCESGPGQQDSCQSPGPSQNESDPWPELPCPSLGDSDPSQQEFGPLPEESNSLPKQSGPSSREKFEEGKDADCSQPLVVKGCDKVNDDFLDAVAEEISDVDIEKVCRALGMKQSAINNIKDRYLYRSDLGFQLLYAVSKKEGKKLTYQRLITTLRETKNTNAADELTKKFNIQL
ncbi:uncharacterized protein [Diadema antillarum]|uniref:uncharacterized protein n=1 Tax=Diadema antillarum TaxID=105358 RepID=UPI003A87D57C